MPFNAAEGPIPLTRLPSAPGAGPGRFDRRAQTDEPVGGDFY
jgi:hypothetical protein